MDLYDVLKDLDEEEVDEFVEARIDQLENESVNKKPVLGYYATEDAKLCNDLGDNKGGVVVRCFHKGYLKKGMKVVYGFSVSPSGIVENEGNYYYLNDQQYIYDFCHFIRQFDLHDEYDLFDKILLFIRSYYGIIKQVERDDMFHLIYDSNGKSFPLKKEHDLNWFKDCGSAMCSEYTVMAQNLLSVLGIDTYTVIGAQKVGEYETDSHAFNIVTIPEEDENGHVEDISLILDFSGFVNIYDVKRKKVGESPFIGYIDNFDDGFLVRFLYEEEHLSFTDYNYVKVGEETLQVLFDRDRDYYVNNDLIAEKKSIAKEKRR